MMAVNARGEQLRVLAVHDISCVGKCSLTVALPIISSVGIETAILPTAVLSNHTGGGFGGFTYRDLTDDIIPIVEHWNKENIMFDAVYLGYLGSEHQISIMENIISNYKKRGTLIFIDPVMGDHGKLYKNFNADYPQKMLELCKFADIITPNITEAVLMTGEKFKHGPYTKDYTDNLLCKLSANGMKKIILTGVYFDDYELGVGIYDGNTQNIEYVMSQRLPGFYDGTGDVFASSFIACVMRGKTLKESVRIAEELVIDSIKATKARENETCYGVNFESAISKFTTKI